MESRHPGTGRAPASWRGPGGTRRGSERTPARFPGSPSTPRVDFDGSRNRRFSRFEQLASTRRPRRRCRSPPRRSWAYQTTASRRPGRKASTNASSRRRGRRRNARVTWLGSEPSCRSLGATSKRRPPRTYHRELGDEKSAPGDKKSAPWRPGRGGGTATRLRRRRTRSSGR